MLMIFSLVPLFAVMLVMRLPIRPTVLLAPLALLPMACFALGIGLLISTIGIYFPDIVEMYNILLMAWMYLTPIIYPLDLLPENVRAILVFNPMLYLVDFFRLPIYYGQFPSLTYWLAGFLVSVITLATGWFIFAIRSDEFAYRA